MRGRTRLAGSLKSERRELLEEPQVVLEELAYIVHPVAQHREPVDARAEGIAAVPLRIDAARREHGRVHHAAACDLEPARLLAHAASLAETEHARHVPLRRRLGEREIGWPQPHAELALEKRLDEAVQDRLQIREADVLPDDEPFDLMEHRRVRDIGVAPID